MNEPDLFEEHGFVGCLALIGLLAVCWFGSQLGAQVLDGIKEWREEPRSTATVKVTASVYGESLSTRKPIDTATIRIDCIRWQNARGHLGEINCVCCPVVSSYDDPDSSAFFH